MKNKKERSAVWVFFKTYSSFIKHQPWDYIGMVVLSLFTAIVSPFKVELERRIYDVAAAFSSAGSGDANSVYSLFVVVILVQLFYAVIFPLYRSNVNYVGSSFETFLQRKMNFKTAKIRLKEYENARLYENIELATSASRELRFMTMMFSSELMIYAFQFILVSSVLFSYHPSLVVMGCLAILPEISSRYLQSKNRYQHMNQVQRFEKRKKYFQQILTQKDYAKEIRANSTDEWFLNKWDENRQTVNREKWKMIRKNNRLEALNQAIDLITVFLSYGLVILLLLKGEITVGMLGASLGAVITLKSNFSRIFGLLLLSAECSMKGKYFYKVMDYEEREGRDCDISPQGGLRINDAAFSYIEGKPALHDISLHIQPGEKIAVVGMNGAGKSTLVKLMLGLFEPEEGSVYYGEQNIQGISERSLYRRISAVFQDFCKYNLTLAENIQIADSHENGRMEDIFNGLRDMKVKLKGKPVTPEVLKEQMGSDFGGMELSGGNWQKIAILRGLYKEHDLMIFDEPTAALDPLIEEEILTSVLKQNPDSIKLFVTHRLNTTRLADRIIVVDQGEIAEMGTHDELMDREDSIYRKLWSAQAKWYEVDNLT